MSTLAELKTGETATVRSISAVGMMKKGLLSLGLIRGTEITLLDKGVFGGPLCFIVRGAKIALRASEATLVSVDM